MLRLVAAMMTVTLFIGCGIDFDDCDEGCETIDSYSAYDSIIYARCDRKRNCFSPSDPYAREECIGRIKRETDNPSCDRVPVSLAEMCTNCMKAISCDSFNEDLDFCNTICNHYDLCMSSLFSGSSDDSESGESTGSNGSTDDDGWDAYYAKQREALCNRVMRCSSGGQEIYDQCMEDQPKNLPCGATYYPETGKKCLELLNGSCDTPTATVEETCSQVCR